MFKGHFWETVALDRRQVGEGVETLVCVARCPKGMSQGGLSGVGHPPSISPICLEPLLGKPKVSPGIRGHLGSSLAVRLRATSVEIVSICSYMYTGGIRPIYESVTFEGTEVTLSPGENISFPCARGARTRPSRARFLGVPGPGPGEAKSRI